MAIPLRTTSCHSPFTYIDSDSVAITWLYRALRNVYGRDGVFFYTESQSHKDTEQGV